MSKIVIQKPILEVLSLSPTYGEFKIQKLMKGTANSLAVPLRRTALMYVPAYAPTVARIEGVGDKFQDLSFVKDPTLFIVDKMKDILLRVNKETEKITLSLSTSQLDDKTYVCKAGDLKLKSSTNNELTEDDIQILNPDLILCELLNPDPIYMEIDFKKESYYKHQTEHNVEKPNDLTITSKFCPTLNVKYEILEDKPSLGEETLIISILSDGRVDPHEIIGTSAQIIMAYMGLVTTFAEYKLNPELQLEVNDTNKVNKKDTTLEEILNLSTRDYNYLKGNGIHTVSEILTARNLDKEEKERIIKDIEKFMSNSTMDFENI